MVIAGVTAGFAIMLATALPLRAILSQFIEDEQTLKMVSGIIVRSIILLLCLMLIKSLGFKAFIGVGRKVSLDGFLVIAIPLVIISMGLVSGFEIYKAAGLQLLTLFVISNLLVAMIEEIAFRSLVLPLIIQIRMNKNRVLLVSVCLTAIIFGLLHYLNLFREPQNFSGITSQVVFAICIGIYLGALLLRTRHIFFPILIHFLVNVAFGKGELTADDATVVSTLQTETDWTSVLLTLGLFGLIALGGIFIMGRIDRQEILNTLTIRTDSHEME